MTGDNLVGHFVDAARGVGLSWTRIGTVLGVSKQAAQQKFVPRGSMTVVDFLDSGMGTRCTNRVRTVLNLAESQATMAQSLIGTEHLLLGLLTKARVWRPQS